MLIVDSLPQTEKDVGGRSSAKPILGSWSSALQLEGAASVQLRKKKECARTYEPGGGVSVVPAGDSVVAGGDSVAAAGLVSVAAAGLLAVAAGGLVGAGVAAGSVVSVFCSHAARSAAPARMQIYFFIVLV